MNKPLIRNDLPVPPRTKGRPRSEKWSFLYDMQVGESAHFPFDIESDDFKKFRAQMFSVITRYQKTSGKSFTVRTNDEGVGVWRTE